MNNKENKNCKSNSFNSFNNNHNLSGSELLKFEYRKDSGRSWSTKSARCSNESRKIGGSNQHLIESNYGLLTGDGRARPQGPQGAPSGRQRPDLRLRPAEAGTPVAGRPTTFF